MTQNDTAPGGTNRKISWMQYLTWAVAILMIALMLFMILKRAGIVTSSPGSNQALDPLSQLPSGEAASLPSMMSASSAETLTRDANLRTIFPSRPRTSILDYTVESGDSVFGIAQKFNLQPESILWANYSVLNDDPHLISIGQELLIPPTDGVLYKWKEGDTIDKIAGDLLAEVSDILLWPGNNLDITNPQIPPDTLVMVPGGQREFRTWVVPTIPRGAAGVNTSIYGPGACDTSAGGAYGTGTFVWPAPNHSLSGNDYWSGHLAIDIAAFTGDPIYAADSGLVVYAGPVGGGYGNMVMIDHGNGYQTLYAHLNTWAVSCGRSVYQGQVIGQAGSTGNSTGPHLHFEIRYYGGFVNPWYLLY